MSYSSVQALDRKVRAFDFGSLASEMQEQHWRVSAEQEQNVPVQKQVEEPSLAAMMQRQLVLCIKESGMCSFLLLLLSPLPLAYPLNERTLILM